MEPHYTGDRRKELGWTRSRISTHLLYSPLGNSYAYKSKPMNGVTSDSLCILSFRNGGAEASIALFPIPVMCHIQPREL